MRYIIRDTKDLPDLSEITLEENLEVDIKIKILNSNLLYPINVVHENPGLESKIDIKLILLGESFVEIPVNILIKKNAYDTLTCFNALVFLIGESSKARITPSLMIHEKNILAASHGLVIKNIKSRDTYYLQSRGLTFSEAINLILSL